MFSLHKVAKTPCYTCIFAQPTAANSRQRRWVLKISILSVNSSKMGSFRPKIWHFWTKIFRPEELFPTICRQPKILGRGNPPATTPLIMSPNTSTSDPPPLSSFRLIPALLISLRCNGLSRRKFVREAVKMSSVITRN